MATREQGKRADAKWYAGVQRDGCEVGSRGSVSEGSQLPALTATSFFDSRKVSLAKGPIAGD